MTCKTKAANSLTLSSVCDQKVLSMNSLTVSTVFSLILHKWSNKRSIESINSWLLSIICDNVSCSEMKLVTVLKMEVICRDSAISLIEFTLLTVMSTFCKLNTLQIDWNSLHSSSKSKMNIFAAGFFERKSQITFEERMPKLLHWYSFFLVLIINVWGAKFFIYFFKLLYDIKVLLSCFLSLW